MKRKKTLLLIMCICLLLSGICVGDVRADSTGVCFIAINDTLLELTTMPYFFCGGTYVPSSVFSSLKVYSSYFPESSTGTLYNSQKQLYFELSTGETYDGDGNTWTYSAIMREGQVYVPAPEVCSFFGLSYSYTPGSGSGDVVRIKNSSASYSNTTFMDKASVMMQQRCNAYLQQFGDTAPIVTPSPTPGATAPPATTNPGGSSGGVSPSPTPEINRSATSVYFGFQGLPDSGVIKALDKYNIKSCFFLTGDDILSDPAAVRSLVAGGHIPGVYCGEDPERDYHEVSQLIFEVCRVMPLIISSDAENGSGTLDYAAEHRLSYFEPNVTGLDVGEGIPGAPLLYAGIEIMADRADVMITCGGDTEAVLTALLKRLGDAGFSIRNLRENTPQRSAVRSAE